jgi:hypothetical protein
MPSRKMRLLARAARSLTVGSARGIHPAILAKGGLGPALKTLARRSNVPVRTRFHANHWPVTKQPSGRVADRRRRGGWSPLIPASG